jgi:hypothetical protein
MRIGSTLTVSFRALRRNILRSSLTALGIIINFVNALQYVPNRRYIPVIPPLLDCVAV